MEIIKAKRFLVRSLFDGERISQLRLVDLTGPTLIVTPFEMETPATVFIDARVVLLDGEKASLGEIPDFDRRLSMLAEGKAAESGLCRYMAEPGRSPVGSVIAVAY